MPVRLSILNDFIYTILLKATGGQFACQKLISMPAKLLGNMIKIKVYNSDIRAIMPALNTRLKNNYSLLWE